MLGWDRTGRSSFHLEALVALLGLLTPPMLLLLEALLVVALTLAASVLEGLLVPLPLLPSGLLLFSWLAMMLSALMLLGSSSALLLLVLPSLLLLLLLLALLLLLLELSLLLASIVSLFSLLMLEAQLMLGSSLDVPFLLLLPSTLPLLPAGGSTSSRKPVVAPRGLAAVMVYTSVDGLDPLALM